MADASHTRSSETLTRVPGFRVGHAQVEGGRSGCTVILGPFRGAVEISGLATGTREVDVLSPHHLVGRADAILLTWGSAFGLAAADGVAGWLENREMGYDTGVARVPIVPAAVVFDLDPTVGRPGPEEGARACDSASDAPVQEGRVGAGAGATVGKAFGVGRSSPGGVGSAAGPWGTHWVGALAVVNALGDVVAEDGRILAGARDEAGGFLGTDSVLFRGRAAGPFSGDVEDGPGRKEEGDGSGGRAEGPRPGTNTTLVVVGTDRPLGRIDLGRLARMAASALPRAITPVGTPYDGDLTFALSTGEEAPELPPGELLSLGVLARAVTEEAIRRAVAATHERAGTEPGSKP
jgi:L-aminopeptidase/D-esterase-like protein